MSRHPGQPAGLPGADRRRRQGRGLSGPGDTEPFAGSRRRDVDEAAFLGQLVVAFFQVGIVRCREGDTAVLEGDDGDGTELQALDAVHGDEADAGTVRVVRVAQDLFGVGERVGGAGNHRDLGWREAGGGCSR